MIAPPPGTVERWAYDYILATDLDHKLHPPPPPRAWEPSPPERVIPAPGRAKELAIAKRAPKTPGPDALRSPERRAALVHAFLHHEVQAAELMAFAMLAFAGTPRAFRGGLLHIARDEIRHANLYADHLARLGARYGSFPVRDWFWERIPSARSPAGFVATMGVGFEGANLDHTARFADRFRAIGDEEGARLQETIRDEEIPHVRFAARWFRRFAGHDLTFDAWRAHLPPPLSPTVMKGSPIQRDPRGRAGLSDPFLDALDQWTGTEHAPGS